MRVIVIIWWVSGKDNPIWVIGSSYDSFTFFTHWTGNRSNCWPRRLLDEDDIEVFANFQHCICKKFVFSNILWKYSEGFLKLYLGTVHKWTNWFVPVFTDLLICFGVPFSIKYNVSRMDRCWNQLGDHLCNWYTWMCMNRVHPVLSQASAGWVWNWPYNTTQIVCSVWFCMVHCTSHIWTLVLCTKRLNDLTSSNSCIVELLDLCLCLKLLQYNSLY